MRSARGCIATLGQKVQHGAGHHPRNFASINSTSQTINRALGAAGLHADRGVLTSVTSTIEKAVASAGLTQLRAPVPGYVPRPSRPPRPIGPPQAQVACIATYLGQFLSLSHSSGHGSRAYKLYVPSSYRGEAVPLIVMLHGCKQNPDDFAAGTRMNELAERDGFLVAYPAQTARENGANCWNWFESKEQSRHGAEPSLIAGIVGEISGAYAVDTSRVFVAGLSAGAAMAVILAAAYPEIFAGVAAHSGLPVGAAHDVLSAFSAMQGRLAPSSAGAHRSAVPTIVFHGDADYTVAASNGAAIGEQAVTQFAASDTTLQPGQRSRGTLNGKKFSTTEYVDADGKTRVEDWVVHGGSHTWFGGSSEGSYTDASGPNASAEIVRFFLAQES